MLRKAVVALFIFISVLSILTIHSGLATTEPAQYGQVDIWTNKGGQGPGQYGGSFTIGESITLFLYSSFDGYGTLVVCYPGGGCSEVDEGSLYAGQVIRLVNTVGAPAGQHQLILQVCPSGAPTTTYITPPAQRPPDTEELPNYVPNSSCPGDTTVIDVYGGPPDIFVSRCWVTPTHPLQEDQVTFYATVGNSGGTDANNVEIDAYVDGNLFSSERQTLSAGSSGTWYSNSKWTAQDGSHTLRVVANADRSVQESNYANNEASCTFFVSPHTIRVTITQTTTSTKTTSQWTTTTSTIEQHTTKIVTSQTTVESTLTANPILTSITTTGLWYTTIYSPTVTTTVTVAQAISNPFYSIAFLILALPFIAKEGSLEGNAFVDFMSHLSRVLRSKGFRKTLIALLLITVSVLSFVVISIRPGFASTITITSTRSQTLLTTLTTSLTSTRYATSSITSTSTSTKTSVQYTTITPTSTTTITGGSTSSIYVPVTTTSYTTQSSELGQISIEARVLDASCSYQPATILKGEPYCLQLQIAKQRGMGIEIDISGNLAFGGDANQQVGGRSSWVNWSLDPRPKSTAISNKMSMGTEQTSAQLNLGRYHLNWNWIPPIDSSDTTDWFWSTIWDIIDTILDKLGDAGLLGAVWGLLDLAKEIDTAISVLLHGTLSENWLLQISATTSSGQSVSLRNGISAHVTDTMIKGFELSIANGIGAVIGSIIVIAASCSWLGPQISVACVAAAVASAVLGWVAFAAGEAAYKAATDPSGNYYSIVTPNMNIPPSVQNLPEGNAKNLALSALQFFAYIDAYSQSMTRFYSANMNDAQNDAYNQIEAAGQFLVQSQVEFGNVKQAYSALNFPALTKQTLSERIANIKQNFPSELDQLYSELGGQNFRNNLLSYAGNVTALVAPDQSVRIDNMLSGISESLDSEAKAVNDLKSSLPKPTGGLWQDGYLTILSSALATIAVIFVVTEIALQRRKRSHKIRTSRS